MSNGVNNILVKCYRYISKLSLLQCIRESLVLLVPILMLGTSTLVLSAFPLEIYQDFINTFCGGIFALLFQYLHKATFGLLALYLTVSVSLCYTSRLKNTESYYFGPIFASICAFCILSGVFAGGTVDVSVFGINGVFTAMLSGLGASALYAFVNKSLKIKIRFYTYGADDIFNNMFKYIIPTFIVALVCSAISFAIKQIFGADSFQQMCTLVLSGLFDGMGASIWSSLLYIILIHILWFFGIHGANTLGDAGIEFLEMLPGSTDLAVQGIQSSEIFNKTFMDAFVTMGGCGTAICLTLAMLIAGRKKSTRKLAKLAAVPTLFNINELLLFGYPIVFNPVMLIPFFMVPVVLLFISSAAIQLGIVPVVTAAVDWTTPVILGGYQATGSFAGAILQLVNILAGTCIYIPFVKLLDNEAKLDMSRRIEKLIDIMKESEKTRVPVRLLQIKDEAGVMAKFLADEIEEKIGNKLPTLHYQPQFNEQGKCIGVEALLRYKQPEYGMIYPPLILKIAEEIGLIEKYDEDIFLRVMDDMPRLKDILGKDIKISINVTGVSIQTDEYEQFLKNMKQKYPQHCENVMLELTEQATLKVDQEFIDRLTRIKEMGYKLGIDDFSMGNTSVKYLQSNVFNMIKLDGALSMDVLENARSQGIIASIAQMSRELDLQILAEYVETEEQRKILEDIGCCLYQGYLFSSAVTIDELEERIKAKKM